MLCHLASAEYYVMRTIYHCRNIEGANLFFVLDKDGCRQNSTIACFFISEAVEDY